MSIKPENIPEPYRVTINFSSKNGEFGGGVFSKVKWLIDPQKKNRLFAAMPDEQVNFSSKVEWEQLFKVGLDALNNYVQFITEGEQSTRTKELSKQTWQRTGRIELSLDLRFMTYSDPFEDVIRPSMTLLALTLPSETVQESASSEAGVTSSAEKFFLSPPVSDNDRITISVGNFMILDNVLIQGVDISQSSTMCTSPSFENKSFPLFADVTLEILTKVIPTKEEPGFDINVDNN